MTHEDRELVRAGYDDLGAAYRDGRPADGADLALLEDFAERVPAGARVLDAGCGPGEPVTPVLAERYDVVGLDFSREQLRLARAAVPDAAFVCGDLTDLGFAADAFAGVVSYYAIIHVPRDQDPAVFAGLHRVLEPGGWALLCLGGSDRAELRDVFLDPDVELFWSAHDEATYRELLADAGFRVVWTEWVPDPLVEGEHLFVLARAE